MSKQKEKNNNQNWKINYFKKKTKRDSGKGERLTARVSR
jgi:hypothetical protein